MPIAKPAAHRLLSLLFATLLGGCTLGPDYQLPAVAVASQWYAPLPHGLQWWG
ncbi:hypothetical protein QNM99_27230 [Pseudomonas sp. PCH446]